MDPGPPPQKIPGSKFPGMAPAMMGAWEGVGNFLEKWERPHSRGWEYPKDSWEFLQGDVKGKKKKSWNFIGRGCEECWEKRDFWEGRRSQEKWGFGNGEFWGGSQESPQKSGILGKNNKKMLIWDFPRSRSKESQEKGNKSQEKWNFWE